MAATTATRPRLHHATHKQSGVKAHRTRLVPAATERRPVDVDAAYDACELITRAQAPNLYHAIEPLPAYRRRSLCAIYAFAHRVRDAADSNLPLAKKLRLLAEARAGIPREGTPRPVDPVLVALRDTHRRFPLPLDSLDDLIDGAENDVYGVAYHTFEELVRYCRQVAGSIGRLTVRVLGNRNPVTAGRLADDLGVAMQLTKILRDLVDDHERGRVYLPREELARFGCSADLASAPPQSLSALIRYQARRNRAWYDRGLSLLTLLNARGAACIATMTGTYTRGLDRIQSLAERGIASTYPAAPSEPGAHRGDRACVHSTNSAMAANSTWCWNRNPCAESG
jgi:phytoene synthase